MHLVPQYLNFKVSHVRFPVQLSIKTNILHIIMDNLVVVLFKSSKY